MDRAYLLYGQVESEVGAVNLNVGSIHKLKSLSAPKPISNADGVGPSEVGENTFRSPDRMGIVRA